MGAFGVTTFFQHRAEGTWTAIGRSGVASAMMMRRWWYTQGFAERSRIVAWASNVIGVLLTIVLTVLLVRALEHMRW